MTKKFNLSEAAAEILAASVAGKRPSRETFSANKGAKWVDGGEQGKEDLGGIVTHGDEKDPAIGHNASAKMGKATPPGATPPVGTDPHGVGAEKIKGPQDTEGRYDLTHRNEPHDGGDPEAKGANKDRSPAKKLLATFKPNKGAPVMDGPAMKEEHEPKDDKGGKKGEAKTKDEKGTKDKKDRDAEMKVKMKEDIDALLSGEELSEEFQEKAATIFEAAVMTRVDIIQEDLIEQLSEQFDEAVETLKEEMVSTVDQYLTYVVERWMEENQLAVDQGLRAEINEDLLEGLHKLFSENYISIPDEKVDVVEELSSEIEKLSKKLDEEVDYGISLMEQVKELKKTEVIHAVCEGLTQTQVEKIRALAENVEFTTEEEFAEKMETLKESYFPSGVKQANASDLEEGVDIEEDPKAKKTGGDPLMESYVNAVSKTILK